MSKIFAFDLDGTLFMQANDMHPNTQIALRNAQKLGHHNLISTGRSLPNILVSLGENINMFSYIVASNGSVLYNTTTKQISILGNVALDAFEILFDATLNHNYIMRIDTTQETTSYLNSSQPPQWLSKQNVMDINKFKVCDQQEFKRFGLQNKDQIVQMALRGPKDEIYREFLKVQEKLGQKYEVKYTNEVYVDINAKDINKWSGVKYAANKLNISTSDVYCFGDSGNDIEMLKYAGIGVAMGNATQDAKEAADIIIGDNKSDAIATFINETI